MTNFKLLASVLLVALAACGNGGEQVLHRSSGGGGNSVVNMNPCGSGCAQDLTPDGDVGDNIKDGKVDTAPNETTPEADDDTSTPPDAIWG